MVVKSINGVEVSRSNKSGLIALIASRALRHSLVMQKRHASFCAMQQRVIEENTYINHLQRVIHGW